MVENPSPATTGTTLARDAVGKRPPCGAHSATLRRGTRTHAQIDDTAHHPVAMVALVALAELVALAAARADRGG
jgi:hypothetical protein